MTSINATTVRKRVTTLPHDSSKPYNTYQGPHHDSTLTSKRDESTSTISPDYHKPVDRVSQLTMSDSHVKNPTSSNSSNTTTALASASIKVPTSDVTNNVTSCKAAILYTRDDQIQCEPFLSIARIAIASQTRGITNISRAHKLHYSIRFNTILANITRIDLLFVEEQFVEKILTSSRGIPVMRFPVLVVLDVVEGKEITTQVLYDYDLSVSDLDLLVQ